MSAIRGIGPGTLPTGFGKKVLLASASIHRHSEAPPDNPPKPASSSASPAMLRVIIRCPYRIALPMRELPLDRIPVPPLLIQEGTRHAPKPMRRHIAPRIPQQPQRTIY